MKAASKCPYSEFIWSLFFHNRIENGDFQDKSPYSVQMQKNTDQKNSEFKTFFTYFLAFKDIEPMTLFFKRYCIYFQHFNIT